MKKELSEQEKDLLDLFRMKILMISLKLIIKLLADLGVLIGGVTETVKHKIKRQEGRFLRVLLAPLVASLEQPVVSSVVKSISGRGVRIEGSGYMNKKF